MPRSLQLSARELTFLLSMTPVHLRLRAILSELAARCAEMLKWRVDQTQSSATTKRQLEALEALGHMQVDSVSERRTRCVILGLPKAAELAKEKNSWTGCAQIIPMYMWACRCT